MPDGLGMMSYVKLSFQNALNGVNTTSGHWFPFVSESVSEDRAKMESKQNRFRYNEPNSRFGLRTVGGDLVVEVDPLTIGAMFMGALGTCVTTSASTHKDHLFTEANSHYGEGLPIQPFKLDIYRDCGSHDVYKNLFANSLTMKFAHGEFLGATMGVIGGNHETGAPVTPSFYTEVLAPKLDFTQCSMQIKGAAIDDFTSLEIQILNNLEARPTLNGREYPTRWRRSNFRQWRVTGAFDMVDRVLWDEWDASSSSPLAVAVAYSPTNALTIEIPDFEFDTLGGNVGGQGVANASFTGRAKHDTVTGKAGSALLRNTDYDMDTYGAGTIA